MEVNECSKTRQRSCTLASAVIFQEVWALYTNSDFYCVVARLIPCVLFTRHFTSDKSAFLVSITWGLVYSQCRGNSNPNSPSSLVTGTLNTSPTLGVNRCRWWTSTPVRKSAQRITKMTMRQELIFGPANIPAKCPGEVSRSFSNIKFEFKFIHLRSAVHWID